MSVVAPITVTWQNVNDPNLDSDQKEIETFKNLEPAIVRANEVIDAAEDPGDGSYSKINQGEDAVSHITLHPGDYQFNNVGVQDLGTVYITILPGAEITDAGQVLSPQVTQNVADLTTLALLTFFDPGTNELIFTTDFVVDTGSFGVDVGEIDMDAQNVTNISTNGGPMSLNAATTITESSADHVINASDSATVNTDDWTANVGSDWEVNAENTEITPTNEHRIAGDPVNASMVVELPATFQNDLSVQGATTLDGNLTVNAPDFIDLNSGDSVSVEATSYDSLVSDHTIDASGTVTVDGGTSIDMTTSDLTVSATNTAEIFPTVSYDVETESSTVNLVDESSTTATTPEHRIAGDPTVAKMVVEVPTTFDEDVTFNGAQNITGNTGFSGDFEVNAPNFIRLNSQDEVTINGDGFVDILTPDYELDADSASLTGAQSVSVSSGETIDLTATGGSNPSISLDTEALSFSSTTTDHSVTDSTMTVGNEHRIAGDPAVANMVVELPLELQSPTTLTDNFMLDGNLTVNTPSFIDMSSGDSVDIEATNAYNNTATTYTLSSTDATLGASNSLAVNGNSVTINGATSANVSTTTYNLTASDSAVLEGTNSFTVNTTSYTLAATDSVSISGTNTVDVTTADYSLSASGSATLTGTGSVNLASDDLVDINATGGANPEVAITTETVSLDATTYSADASDFTVNGGTSITLDSGNSVVIDGSAAVDVVTTDYSLSASNSTTLDATTSLEIETESSTVNLTDDTGTGLSPVHLVTGDPSIAKMTVEVPATFTESVTLDADSTISNATFNGASFEVDVSNLVDISSGGTMSLTSTGNGTISSGGALDVSGNSMALSSGTSYDVTATSYSMTADNSSNVTVNNGPHTVTADSISVNSTTGNVAIDSSSELLLDASTDASITAGSSLDLSATDYSLAASGSITVTGSPTVTKNVGDYTVDSSGVVTIDSNTHDVNTTTYDVAADDSLITIVNEHRIAGDPANGQMVVEVPATFQDDITVQGTQTINQSTTQQGDFEVNAPNFIRLNSQNEITLDAEGFIDAETPDYTLTVTNSASVLSDNDITLSATNSNIGVDTDILIESSQNITLDSTTHSNTTDSYTVTATSDGSITVSTGPLTLGGDSVDISSDNGNITATSSNNVDVTASAGITLDSNTLTLTPTTSSSLQTDSSEIDVGTEHRILSTSGGATFISEIPTNIQNTLNVFSDFSAGSVTANNLSSTNVPYVASGGQFTDDSDFSYDDSSQTLSVPNLNTSSNVTSNTLNASQVFVSSLTDGRITYAGPSGEIIDNSTLTFDDTAGSETLTAPNLNVMQNFDVAGDAVIQGNLEVQGTTTTIETQTLQTSDPIIGVNSGNAPQDGGLEILDSNDDTVAQVLWDNSEGYWTTGALGDLVRVVRIDGVDDTTIEWDATSEHLQVISGSIGNSQLSSELTVGNPPGSGESTFQGNSNQAGDGYVETPWVYSTFIEAPGERDSSSTGVAIGSGNGFLATDEIALVTGGTQRLTVTNTGTTIAGSATVDGSTTLNSTLDVSGDVTFNSNFGFNTGVSVSTIQSTISSATADANLATEGAIVSYVDTQSVSSLSGGTDVNVSSGTGDVTINHADTGAADFSGSANSVVNGIQTDGRGHVDSISSTNLDDRYYTETEADNNFVDESGDTMTGTLTNEDSFIAGNGPTTGLTFGNIISTVASGNGQSAVVSSTENQTKAGFHTRNQSIGHGYEFTSQDFGNFTRFLFRGRDDGPTASFYDIIQTEIGDSTGDIVTKIHDNIGSGGIKSFGTVTFGSDVDINDALQVNSLNFAGGTSVNSITTSLGDPGDDSTLATEQAIREAVDNAGGDVTSVSGGTDINVPSTTGGVTVNHADTGSDSSTGNSGVTAIQNIDTDGRGHVTSVSTTDTYQRWRLEGDIDQVFIENDEIVRITTPGGDNAGVLSTDIVSLTSPFELEISHDNIAGAESTGNTGGTVIQSFGSSVGHVNSVSTIDLDNRYYTQSSADGNFVDESGDTMTGDLTIADGNNLVFDSTNQNGALSNTSGHKIEFEGQGIEINSNNTAPRLSIGDQAGNDGLDLVNNQITRVGSMDSNGTIDVNNGSGASYSIQTDSDIRSEQDVIANYSSDRRLKTNIKDIDSALDKVDEITGVKYDWTEDFRRDGTNYGFIAQEVREVLPESVTKRNDGTLGLDYKQTIPLLANAIRELKRKDEEKSKKIEKLRKRIQKLK